MKKPSHSYLTYPKQSAGCIVDENDVVDGVKILESRSLFSGLAI